MFARHVFRWSGIYGLVVVLPLFLLEARIGQDHPPPITHPEFYYGFATVTLAWQVAFLVMATDPVRYRPLMPVAVIEKGAYVVAIAALALTRGLAASTLATAAIDMILGILFVVAWRRTPTPAR